MVNADQQREWEHANRWAEGLTDRELGAVLRLKVPGAPGLAAKHEAGRRNPAFPSARREEAV